MKVTVSYKMSQQISPDDFHVYTKVIHFSEKDTLEYVHKKMTERWCDKTFNGEIHFDEINL